MKDKNILWKPAPGPWYDIETTEAWLTDMAKQGLFLSKDGFFLSFGRFEKGEPANVRYRLIVSYDGVETLGDDRPDPEERSHSQSLGWEYVCTRGQFYIYCTRDIHAPELDTDPEVKAMSVDVVRKRMRGNTINIFVWAVVIPLIYNRFTPVRSAIAFGTGLFLLIAAMAFWELVDSIRMVRFLKKLRRRIVNDELKTDCDWRKSLRRRWTAIGINTVGWVLVVVLVALRLEFAYNLEVPLKEYTGDIPFATLADIVGGESEYEGGIYGGNTIEELSDILAPRAITYDENAYLTLEDGTKFSGGMTVHYYETAAPWIAKTLAKEYIRQYKIDNLWDAEILDPPELDADFVYAYNDVFPTLIMVKDNIMIEVRGYSTGMRGMDMARWGQVNLDLIKD